MADEPKLTLVERLRAIATAYKITGNKASDEYSACSEAAEEIERLRMALETIRRWEDFPPTNAFWDREKTTPVSYEAQFGSNGARDYMRGIASAALSEQKGFRK